jgi:hypothetical protein
MLSQDRRLHRASSSTLAEEPRHCAGPGSELHDHVTVSTLAMHRSGYFGGLHWNTVLCMMLIRNVPDREVGSGPECEVPIALHGVLE